MISKILNSQLAAHPKSSRKQLRFIIKLLKLFIEFKMNKNQIGKKLNKRVYNKFKIFIYNLKSQYNKKINKQFQ